MQAFRESPRPANVLLNRWGGNRPTQKKSRYATPSLKPSIPKVDLELVEKRMRGAFFSISLAALAAAAFAFPALIAHAEDTQASPAASAAPQQPPMVHQQSLGDLGGGGTARQAQDLKDVEDALDDNMKGREDVEGLQILRLGAAVLNLRDIE